MRLSASTDEGQSLAVLSLEDRDRADLFTLVCADVLAASVAQESETATRRFLTRLDAWRRFLRERHSGLSPEDTIGLIGELLTLERVLAVDTRLQDTWKAPDGGLHDFNRDGHALEVKTSLGPTSLVRISSIDQLDPSGVRVLDLLHLRLIESAEGRSLAGLIQDLSLLLPDEVSRQNFDNALLRRGLMPDDDAARSRPVFEMRSFDAYRVADGFPRIARSALPPAVAEATYSLELRALGQYRTDATTSLSEFAGNTP